MADTTGPAGGRPFAVVSTDGTTVRVDRGHRAMGHEAIDAAMSYALKSQTHLWVATTAHRISVEALERMDEEPLLLDAESLLMTGFGCYVCERPYERSLARRRCPGEPS